MELPVATRAQILEINDIQEEIIKIPEWKLSLKIRGLTLGQLMGIYEGSNQGGEVNGLRATIGVFCAGVFEPQFNFVQDYETLRGKSAVIQRVSARIMKLSGADKGALEEAIKNSDPTQDESLN